MLIGDNWKIEADSLNITLYKKTNSKKSDKIAWGTQGFYSSIPNALKALIDQGVRDTQLKDLAAISARIDELYELIPNLTIKRS